jgi:NitT/TauT family transport system permease protein
LLGSSEYTDIRTVARKKMQGTRIPRFFGLNAEPGKIRTIILGILPFVLIIGAYVYASHMRHLENPFDKMLPSLSQMWMTIGELVFEAPVAGSESGEVVTQSVSDTLLYYWTGFSDSRVFVDTVASLKRIAIGTVCGAYLGLLVGLNMGLFRGLQALTRPLITFLGIVNPLAILSIILIVFGVGEESKYILIGIGIFFPVAIVVYLEAKKISKEQVTKAFTLGASQLDVVYRVVLPQLWPPFINMVAIALGAAWIFLVSAEMISASEGLGYRIFLAKRTTSMDIIIPYVLWMTLLGFILSFSLKRYCERMYPWYMKGNT